MSLNKIYSDIDLTFKAQPVSKDIPISYDENAVLRSIKNLLLTRPYERLFNPELSSLIDFYLFEPISGLTGNQIKQEITRVVTNWEPRVTIASLDVLASPDENGYKVTMYVYIGNKAEPTGITLVLKRSR